MHIGELTLKVLIMEISGGHCQSVAGIRAQVTLMQFHGYTYNAVSVLLVSTHACYICFEDYNAALLIGTNSLYIESFGYPFSVILHGENFVPENYAWIL